MVYLSDAILSLIDTSSTLLSPAQINALDVYIRPVTGHYRLERFNLRLLEDYRQRVSRKGVSLACFQQDHLPVFFALLDYAVSAGLLESVPPLFHYTLPPIWIAEAAPSWLDHIAASVTKDSITRYRTALKMLIPYFSDTDLRQLDGEAVAQYHQHYLDNGGALSSFSFHKTTLYGVLDYVCDQAIRQAGLSVSRPPKPVTIREVVPGWMEAFSADVAPATRDAYFYIAQNYVIPFIGGSDIRRINTRRLETYRQQCRAAGLDLNYLPRHLTVIYSILQYAVDIGLIDTMPTLELRYPSIPPKINRPDETALSQMFLSQDGPGITIIRLAWQAGLTRSEIHSLQWSQVDFQNHCLHIAGRLVPLSSDLEQFLTKLREGSPSDTHVVTSEKMQAPISLPYVSMLARRFLSDYGMTDVRLTDLRHDYVIRQLQAESIETVAKWSGYKNPYDVERLYRDYLPHR